SFDPNAKGNERLINGWATFVAREVTPNPFLILFEYGPDVDRTKSLISDLGCEETVLWMESMSRRELMKGLALSDVVCTNFEISYLSSGVNFEALSLSKPIIGYRSAQHLEEELTESIYPILGAREPEEIADQLTWSVQFPDDAAKIGRAGKVWYEHEAERSISRYVNLLKAQRDLSSESPDV
ncbi:uncharacterized protein METZ01_LOCUS368471, partial [marine metagenome]